MRSTGAWERYYEKWRGSGGDTTGVRGCIKADAAHRDGAVTPSTHGGRAESARAGGQPGAKMSHFRTQIDDGRVKSLDFQSQLDPFRLINHRGPLNTSHDRCSTGSRTTNNQRNEQPPGPVVSWDCHSKHSYGRLIADSLESVPEPTQKHAVGTRQFTIIDRLRTCILGYVQSEDRPGHSKSGLVVP